MKIVLFAALLAAALIVTGCAADPTIVVPDNHPAHPDAPTPSMRSQVTALDADSPNVASQPAVDAADHDHHARHAQADASKRNVKPYPLDVCVVSDEKLGEHGRPFVFEDDGREIKLCCKMCLEDFQKDPAAHLKKLDEAASHQHAPSAQQGTDAPKPREAHNEHRHEAAAGAAQAGVDKFFTAYLSAAELLAKDDFAGAAKQFDTIHRAGHRLGDHDNEKVADLGDRIGRAAHKQPQNIKEARASFKVISPLVIELMRVAPPSPNVASVVREAYCPMAKAPWLQTGEKVANPYFGAEMLNCGNITRTTHTAKESHK